MNRIIPFVIFFFIALTFAIYAQAATTWTVQPEKYYTYNTTPLAAKETLKRVLTTDTKIVIKPDWVKVGDLWTKEISSGGAVRYIAVAAEVPTEPNLCNGQFICHEDWGWIVAISENQVLKCTAVKITKDQATAFESAISVSGEPTCPSIK